MKRNPNIEVIEFTDPVCTWCWGSEPVLKKLEAVYGEQLKISFIMGGLVEDIRTFRDERNKIGGDLLQDNQNIAKHWLEASERHGMPVKIEGFNLFTEDHPSTYPTNIAYKAAQFQGEKLASKFLRRIREATAVESKQTNRREVLLELAGECGLNVMEFERSLSNGTAESSFREDQKIARGYGVSGFPTFLIRNLTDSKELLLSGYQPFENFRRAINRISNGKATEKKLYKTEDEIVNFIGKYDRVAPVEISTVFDLPEEELSSTLKSLEQQKRVIITRAGNGYFILKEL